MPSAAAMWVLLPSKRSSEVHDGTRRTFNSAFSLGTDAGRDGVRERYDKRRLLPFSETRPFGEVASLGTRGDLDTPEYTPGSRLALFDVEGQALAPLICMETLYPELAREAALAGADGLVNLSNDGWLRGRGGVEQYLAMVTFRAIETRRPVLRSTSNGISAMIGIDGSLIASLGRNESGVLRAELPASPEGITLYTRIGDAFAIACVSFVAAAVALAAVRASQTPAARTSTQTSTICSRMKDSDAPSPRWTSHSPTR